MSQKIKIGIFDLTGCEGCEFHLFSLDELLLDVFQDFEITNWRLLGENEGKDFDIAFIEGAVTTKKHIDLLKQIRETSKFVISLGACAISGNFFAQLTPEQRKKLAPKIYDKNYKLKAEFLRPVSDFIKVDKEIPGCPPDIEKFKKLLADLKGEKITSIIKDVEPPEYVAQIEGHGRLKINFRQKEAEFEVEESERLIEGLLLGKDFRQAPLINSRICGICPVAHNLCSWKAIEKALKILPTQETIILRKLMMTGQMIKSHLLHLFFLVLPDYANLKNSLDLSGKYPAEFHLMLTIKRASEKILHLIAGSTAFPIFTGLGGFKKIPEIKKLIPLRDNVADVLDEAEDLVALFASLKSPSLESEITFLTTQPPQGEYPLYESTLTPQIKEVVKTGSTAKLGILGDGKIVKVGSLPRMAGFANRLNPKAKILFEKYKPNFKNPYHNNLTQAIEVTHYLEETTKLVESLIDKNLKNAEEVACPEIQGPTASGQACLEAPRGILIHQVTLDREKKIKDYNIIPPTQINLASLEKEAQQLIEEKTDWKKEKLQKEIEKLIRAFDPCITCAVH